MPGACVDAVDAMTRPSYPFRLAPAARLAACLAVLFGLALAGLPPQSARAETGPSGLPLPRFVSLRADEVNLRTGPGVRYPIEWVYVRKDLPVQIVSEFEAWRQVRDVEGTTGWVHRSMLSGKRTAAINGDVDRMYRKPSHSAPVAAFVEAGIVGELQECEGAWCRITVAGHGVTGWIERRGLWGVLPGEAID